MTPSATPRCISAAMSLGIPNSSEGANHWRLSYASLAPDDVFARLWFLFTPSDDGILTNLRLKPSGSYQRNHHGVAWHCHAYQVHGALWTILRSHDGSRNLSIQCPIGYIQKPFILFDPFLTNSESNLQACLRITHLDSGYSVQYRPI